MINKLRLYFLNIQQLNSLISITIFSFDPFLLVHACVCFHYLCCSITHVYKGIQLISCLYREIQNLAKAISSIVQAGNISGNS